MRNKKEVNSIDISLWELVDLYCTHNHHRPSTRTHYEKVCRVFIRDTGVQRVDEVTNQVIFMWRVQILGRAKRNTWNNYYRHLRALLRFAFKNGYLSEDPTTGLRQIPQYQKAKKTVPFDLLERAVTLLNQPSNPLEPGWFWSIVIQTFYETGMRRRQLVGLRWRDVDFYKETILLRAETSKNYKEWRIPVSAGLLSHLKRLETSAYPVKPEDQVFNVTLYHPKYKGNKMTEEQVSGFFQRLSKALGAKISSHRLRHTMATELARQENTQLKVLQHQLGHTTFSTTLEYFEVSVDDQRSLVSKLHRLHY